MGAFAVPLAIAGSIASTGFTAASSIAKGQGEKAAADARASQAEFNAQRAERAAEFGRVQADQTGAQLREELSSTLANIDAIRAASGIDPTSPTGIAIKDRETYISDRDRRNRETSIRLQADEDSRTAKYDRSVASYERSVGNFAVKSSYLSAGAVIGGGIAKGMRDYGGVGYGGYG